MIKYFHELTEQEYKNNIVGKMNYGECDEMYPQPLWCSYYQASWGMMGCWSLICFMVTGEDYCRGCDCYISKKKRKQIAKGLAPSSKEREND